MKKRIRLLWIYFTAIILISLIIGCSSQQETEMFLSTENVQSPVPTSTLKIQTATPAPLPTTTIASTISITPTMNSADLYEILPIKPQFVQIDNGIQVFFGDEYKELPEAEYVDEIIVPKLIIIHTDGQTINLPQNWNTESTFFGLGTGLSSHFAVSPDEILQMLPMYPHGVLHGSGAAPQYNDKGEYITYNNRSIHIEMTGYRYNDMITGYASPEMVTAIEKVTDKTTDLVVSLMVFYNIKIDNVLGHYQVNRGKADPGDLYFEKYFLPQLENKWENLQLLINP
ncbi:MAG: peptidoglycan recognition family protein [Anaerolineaceae bacterium]